MCKFPSSAAHFNRYYFLSVRPTQHKCMVSIKFILNSFISCHIHKYCRKQFPFFDFQQPSAAATSAAVANKVQCSSYTSYTCVLITPFKSLVLRALCNRLRIVTSSLNDEATSDNDSDEYAIAVASFSSLFFWA